jgi:hypothetical protein
VNALNQVRLRSASPYVAPGQAPDQGLAVGFQAQAGANVGADATVQTTGVLLLLIVGILVVAHVATK